MKAQPQVDKIMKLEDGTIAVKWKGERKYVVVDKEIGMYLIAMIALGKDEFNSAQTTLVAV